MYKILVILIFSLFPFNASAEKHDDAEESGHLAGIMYACGAHRMLSQYEAIMSRYFSNTTNSPDAEKAKLKLYVQAKASSYFIYRKRHKFDCASALNDFSNMSILRTELYSDGSLRMPDGKYLYPRGQKKMAPDAKKIYPEKSGK